MTTLEEEKADSARSALISDIRDLQDAGKRTASQLGGKLPWVIAGGIGLVAFGVVLAAKPKRRASNTAQRSLLGKAARTAALAAVGILARRLATRALDKALPERAPEQARLDPAA